MNYLCYINIKENYDCNIWLQGEDRYYDEVWAGEPRQTLPLSVSQSMYKSNPLTNTNQFNFA